MNCVSRSIISHFFVNYKEENHLSIIVLAEASFFCWYFDIYNKIPQFSFNTFVNVFNVFVIVLILILYLKNQHRFLIYNIYERE